MPFFPTPFIYDIYMDYEYILVVVFILGYELNPEPVDVAQNILGTDDYARVRISYFEMLNMRVQKNFQ